MQDIRSALTERLKGVTQERESLTAKVRELELEESAVRTLLEIENRRFSSKQESLPLADKEPPTSDELKVFINRVMASGRPLPLEKLTKLAEIEGLGVPGKSLGRSLHAVLVSMKRGGFTDNVDSGVWKLLKFDAPHASSGGAS